MEMDYFPQDIPEVVCVSTLGEIYKQAQYLQCGVYSSGVADTVNVRYGSQEGAHHVVKGSEPSLLGRDWVQNIRLEWASIRILMI